MWNGGMSSDEVGKRKQQLLNLPKDWYVDHDGSFAGLPTIDAVDRACAAAARALSLGIVVETIDPDPNGGTCVGLRNERHVELSLYFSNGGGASVVALGQGEVRGADGRLLG